MINAYNIYVLPKIIIKMLSTMMMLIRHLRKKNRIGLILLI